MRKVGVWGVVLVCLAILIAGTGATAQRVRVIEAAATRTPTQVEVTNFPAVQEVAGTIAVSNLAHDASGRLLVSGLVVAAPTVLRVIGYTSPTVLLSITDLSNRCAAEFPQTRICEETEIYRSLPPPETLPLVWTFRTRQGAFDGIRPTCADGSGSTSEGNFSGCLNAAPLPVACCGY